MEKQMKQLEREPFEADGIRITLETVVDPEGSRLHELWVDNGKLRFSVLPERGMDIGEIYLQGMTMSWNRSKEYRLHPNHVNLHLDGWEKGFYAAITTLGPEVFGTPDEHTTDHGTGAYSLADVDSVTVEIQEDTCRIRGVVNIRGYGLKSVYQKEIMILIQENACFIMREEVTKNLTDETVPLDDGYHVQFSGAYLNQGGKFILPVPTHEMLLRDQAPVEENPKAIYGVEETFLPIRCYQYVPQKVYGLEECEELKEVSFIKERKALAAEMLVNHRGTQAAVIIRPLESFPRTLIAKRNDGCSMYAIEPCKSRPNTLRQKAIDGELQFLGSGESRTSQIAFAFFDREASIREIQKRIERAANYETVMEQTAHRF